MDRPAPRAGANLRADNNRAPSTGPVARGARVGVSWRPKRSAASAGAFATQLLTPRLVGARGETARMRREPREAPSKVDGISRAEAARLEGHVFVARGEVALTRALLARGAVRVLEPGRKGRLEQVGVATTPDALAKARAEVDATAEQREVARERSRERRAAQEVEFRAWFDAAVRRLFPSIPAADRTAIVAHACEVGSGRVGRVAAAKAHDDEPVVLAVRAHIRHEHTDYDDRLAAAGAGQPFGRCSRDDRKAARKAIAGELEAVVRAWAAPREGGAPGPVVEAAPTPVPAPAAAPAPPAPAGSRLWSRGLLRR